MSSPTIPSTNGTASKRTPVYFISHGGPSTMYDTTHPVYPQLQAIGREILEEVKPKAIVMISAHWQSDTVDGGVQVSVPDEADVEMAKSGRGLLFDFYGFPKSCEFCTWLRTSVTFGEQCLGREADTG